ncbi:MAG: hemolysin III family protein [Cyclobacteriaceae bacterium]|nr:hemolysin III family protein [Cyclobacteriaceae bacterium]
MKQVLHHDRPQTLAEEIANSISHGAGFAGAVAVTPIMILQARGAAAVTAVSLFGSMMMVLYLASTLYHAIPHNRTKRIFQVLDHSAIYLMIAGTYTPFALIALPPAWGWTILGVIWVLALAGVAMKSIAGARGGKLSTALYLGMGWLAIVAAKPLYDALPVGALYGILAGGAFYSAGVVFYTLDNRLPFSHFVWHLFVLGGTACHVFTVMRYLL